MGQHDDLGLGLIWFTGELACYVFDASRPEGECLTRPSGLLSDHRYLSNLNYEEHGRFLDEHPEMGRMLCMDTTLIVGTTTLAEEIGMPRHEQTKDPEHFQQLLHSLYSTYRHVCLRVGLDPVSMDFTQKGVREFIFYRTTNGALRNVTDAEIKEGISVAPHRWINTGTPLPDGAFPRRLTLSRHQLYHPLLSAPTPVGEWVEGEANATMEVILATRTPTHDILVRGRLKDLPRKGFPDPVDTNDARRYFTGEEMALIAESGREFEILGWYHGSVDSPPALSELDPLSLADDVMLEVMHRSWRENRGTGFWHAVGERIHLQRLAYQIHNAGIPVLSYGSGKIVIATPDDKEDPSARHEQDQRLLELFGAHGIQPPLEHLYANPKLVDMVQHLTHLQALSLAGPEFLRRLDDAITVGNPEAYNAAIDDADIALGEILSGKGLAQEESADPTPSGEAQSDQEDE